MFIQLILFENFPHRAGDALLFWCAIWCCCRSVGWFPYYSQSTVACLFASVLHHLAALFCLFLSFYTSLCVIIFWYWIQLSLWGFHSFSPCIVYCCGCGSHICMYFMPCVLYCCGAHIHICMYVMALPDPWRVFLLILNLCWYHTLHLICYRAKFQITSSPTTFLFFRQVKWSFLISPFLTVNSPSPLQNRKRGNTKLINRNKKATTVLNNNFL